MRAAYAVLVLPFLCVSPGSSGQGAPDELKRAELAVTDPSLSSSVSGGGTRVTLESSTVDSTAKALAGVGLGDSVLSLTLEAPVRKGSKDTTLADLNGLRGGAVGTLSLTRFFIKADSDPQRLFAVCRDFNAEKARAFEQVYGRDLIPPDATGCTVEALSAKGEVWALRAQAAEQAGLRATCTAANKAALRARIIPELGECTVKALATHDPKYRALAQEKVAEELKKVCEAFNTAAVEGLITGPCDYGTLLQAGKEWENRALIAAGVGTHRLVNLFVSGRSDEFEYIELPSLDKKKETKNGFAIGGSVGFVTRDDIYVGIGFRSERTFKAGDAAQYCVPVPGVDAARCQELVAGAPTTEGARVLHAEARYYPAKWLGLIPRVSYETKKKVTGFQLLAFFLKDKEKGLNSGIDFGYRSDTGSLTARVFLGAAFEILP